MGVGAKHGAEAGAEASKSPLPPAGSGVNPSMYLAFTSATSPPPHLGERLPSLTCGRGGERGKKGGSPEDGSARARKGAQGRYRVISKCGSYRVRLRVGQYPRRSVFDIIRNNIIFCVNTYYIIVFFEGFINSQYTLNMCSELTVGGW